MILGKEVQTWVDYCVEFWKTKAILHYSPKNKQVFWARNIKVDNNEKLHCDSIINPL